MNREFNEPSQLNTARKGKKLKFQKSLNYDLVKDQFLMLDQNSSANGLDMSSLFICTIFLKS